VLGGAVRQLKVDMVSKTRRMAKFEQDKEVILKLEKMSVFNEKVVSFAPANDVGFSTFIGYPVEPDDYLSGKYRPMRLKFAELLKSKKSDCSGFSLNPQWRFALTDQSVVNLKQQITESIAKLFPTKLVLVCVASQDTTQTLIFTENEMENTFEFLRGKNWLTDDVSFMHFWSDITASYLYAPDIRISLCDADTGHVNSSSENQANFFKDYPLSHVYCMRKILAKYKDLILNDLTLRQIDPPAQLKIEQPNLFKIELYSEIDNNQGAKWTATEENALALEVKTKTLEEIATLHGRTAKAIKSRLYYQGYDYTAASGEFRKWTPSEDKILLEKIATYSLVDLSSKIFHCHAATVKHRLLKLGYAKMKSDSLRVHDIMKIIKLDFITVNTYVQKQKQKEKAQAERAQKEQPAVIKMPNTHELLEKIYAELNTVKRSLADHNAY